MIKTEEPDYYRDTATMALINTNIKAFREHRMKKEQAERLEKLENDMKFVTSTLQEICQVLKGLGTGK